MGSPYEFKPDPYSSHSLILSCLREGHGRRLLDVGAADGYLAERLGARGFEVTCLEADPLLAMQASTKCFALIMADLNTIIPPLQGPFDVIVFGDVLEHLRNPLEVLIAISKYLKKDGIAIISIPNVAHAWVRLQLLCGKFEYTDRGILDRTHLRFFTRTSFQEIIQQAGLKIMDLSCTPVPLSLIVPKRYQGRIFRAVQALNAALARNWKRAFAYQFVAVTCRKEPNEA